MSAHVSRGVLLYEQDRYALAAKEFRLALGEDPDDLTARGFLALTLLHAGDLAEAERESRLAVRAGAESPFAHAVHAEVLYRRDRHAEAARAAREALRLDPDLTAAYVILAGIAHHERDWQASLEWAEEGLRTDSNSVGCQTFRTMALLNLGRRAEAGDATAEALRQSPDAPLAHAARGWALLHDRRPREALPFFREALRLEPGDAWARQGMIEALKARSWLYRQMLGYFLWMGRLPPSTQFGLMLGLLLVQRVLGALGQQNPAWQPYTLPVLVAVFAFVALTWLAGPLSNLALGLSRFGRLALTRDERRQGYAVGAALALALAAALLGLAAGGEERWIAFVAALGLGLLTIPLSTCFTLPAGPPRWVAVGYTVVMAGLLAAAVGHLLAALDARTAAAAAALLATAGSLVNGVILMGLLGSFVPTLALGLLRGGRT